MVAECLDSEASVTTGRSLEYRVAEGLAPIDGGVRVTGVRRDWALPGPAAIDWDLPWPVDMLGIFDSVPEALLGYPGERGVSLFSSTSSLLYNGRAKAGSGDSVVGRSDWEED